MSRTKGPAKGTLVIVRNETASANNYLLEPVEVTEAQFTGIMATVPTHYLKVNKGKDLATNTEYLYLTVATV